MIVALVIIGTVCLYVLVGCAVFMFWRGVIRRHRWAKYQRELAAYEATYGRQNQAGTV
jgi:hypothetical protein